MPDGGTLELCAVRAEGKIVITVTDGLAVVKRLVESLSGLITFESEGGKGTTFTINLPLEKIMG